jgi:hypothetical protein
LPHWPRPGPLPGACCHCGEAIKSGNEWLTAIGGWIEGEVTWHRENIASREKEGSTCSPEVDEILDEHQEKLILRLLQQLAEAKDLFTDRSCEEVLSLLREQ